MIFNIVALLIMVYALINYKKAYFSFLIFQLFWYSSATLITIGGRSITESLGMNLFFLIMYFIKYPRLRKKPVSFPYTMPFVLVSFSYFFTCFTSIGGFVDEFPRAISCILQFVVNIWLIWRLVEDKRDWEFLYKGLTIAIFFACLYGLIESMVHFNPLFEIKSDITPGGIDNYNKSLLIDRGYRMMSIFEHPIGAGMNFALYASFVFIYIIRSKKKLPYNKLAIITAVLCLFCCVLTKMRSAMLFAVIAMIPIIDFKKKSSYKIIGVILLAFVIVLPFIGEYMNIFATLFDVDMLLYNPTGSSILQRLGQFYGVYNLMLQSPIGGLGEKFADYIANDFTEMALAYESVWLEQMSKHGLIGIGANIILMVYSIFVVPRKFKSKEMLWLSLAYWGIYTMTSVPTFRTSLFYLLLIYYIKSSEMYKEKAMKGT